MSQRSSTVPRRRLSATSDVLLPDLSTEIRPIGSGPINGGGFSDIWLGERPGGEKVALKVLRTYGASELLRRFVAEAAIWSQLKHKNILPFYGICNHHSSLAMVSPWLPGSNVSHYLCAVNPSANRLKLVNDAAHGLLYLHSLNCPIVHGDLKCANILIQSDGTACLADFGLSKLYEEVTATSLRNSGSLRYMAPELFDEHSTKTLASDCYALGQVTTELLSGHKPFSELKNDMAIISALSRRQRPRRPQTDLASRWITDSVWSIVQWMTANVKEDRPTLHRVVYGLQELAAESLSVELSTLHTKAVLGNRNETLRPTIEPKPGFHVGSCILRSASDDMPLFAELPELHGTSTQEGTAKQAIAVLHPEWCRDINTHSDDVSSSSSPTDTLTVVRMYPHIHQGNWLQVLRRLGNWGWFKAPRLSSRSGSPRVTRGSDPPNTRRSLILG